MNDDSIFFFLGSLVCILFFAITEYIIIPLAKDLYDMVSKRRKINRAFRDYQRRKKAN